MNQQQTPNKQLKHRGCLSLRFINSRNKTIMKDCYQTPPLRASRELYINPVRPSQATVYMVETSGGLLEGDQNNFQIDVREGADVCLIPQSATKIYPAHNKVWSLQNINVSIDSNASFSWQTEAIIPFKKARFHGKTVVNMAKDSDFLWGEILSPGRDKSGEIFKYSDVRTNFQIWIEEDCIIYDSLLFSPDQVNLRELGLLEDFLYVGSLWFVHPSLGDIDMRELNDKLQQFEDSKVSAAMLEDKAIHVRWLASDLVVLKQEMNKIWNEFSSFKR